MSQKTGGKISMERVDTYHDMISIPAPAFPAAPIAPAPAKSILFNTIESLLLVCSISIPRWER